jgi:hypothetical protein
MKRIFLPILLGVLMISAVLPSAVVFAGNDDAFLHGFQAASE